MAMLEMPAARRNHRSRTGYTFALLALAGAALTLVVLVRYPAESATRLTEPVPAPEITVVEDPPDGERLGIADDPVASDNGHHDVPAHVPPDGIRPGADAGPGVVGGPAAGTSRTSGIEPG
ncbi:hypothetical protein, partial [Micromonospora sp. KC213]|uniref:hypothetical protein n=1 Tax=Micromonospora sp. KC213 TaxID=2530378 RepID=UPI001048D35B